MQDMTRHRRNDHDSINNETCRSKRPQPFKTALEIVRCVTDCFCGYRLKLLAIVELLLGRLVEGCKISDVRRIRQKVGVGFLHVVDEHAELSPPVSNVVMSEYLRAGEISQSSEDIKVDCIPCTVRKDFTSTLTITAPPTMILKNEKRIAKDLTDTSLAAMTPPRYLISSQGDRVPHVPCGRKIPTPGR